MYIHGYMYHIYSIHIYTYIYIYIHIYIHVYTYICIRINAKVTKWRKRPTRTYINLNPPTHSHEYTQRHGAPCSLPRHNHVGTRCWWLGRCSGVRNVTHVSRQGKVTEGDDKMSRRRMFDDTKFDDKISRHCHHRLGQHECHRQQQSSSSPVCGMLANGVRTGHIDMFATCLPSPSFVVYLGRLRHSVTFAFIRMYINMITYICIRMYIPWDIYIYICVHMYRHIFIHIHIYIKDIYIF